MIFPFLFSLGSQIASWFPSFSVEVMHTRGENTVEGQLPESRIEAMVSYGALNSPSVFSVLLSFSLSFTNNYNFLDSPNFNVFMSCTASSLNLMCLLVN